VIPLHEEARQVLGAVVAVIAMIVLQATATNVLAAAPDLHAAVRAGDVQAVTIALREGVDANVRDEWGRTPLIVALQAKQAAVVELLIRRGADPSAADAWGRSALLVAAQLKNTTAIEQLLKAKADVNAANRNDITPLIAAAQTGNLGAVNLLIQAGAALDRQDNLGWTALTWATNRKDEAIVKALQAAGASAAPARAAKPGIVPAILASPKVSPALDSARIARGNPAAAITIVEYTDFQCPYCAYGARVLEEVMARYEGQLRLVVKHLPLPLLHPMAMPAAQRFEALALQDPAKAWAFYDRVFREQRTLAGGEAALQKMAAETGADMKRLDEDLRSDRVGARIAGDLKEAAALRFDGVPVFVVNGHVVGGAQPTQVFFDLIDALLRG
jgi:protein-disulfide isomerase